MEIGILTEREKERVKNTLNYLKVLTGRHERKAVREKEKEKEERKPKLR